MGDIIDFAAATAMRLGEIIRIRWEDLNEADRTVIIRDRKHPREKVGNDQEVPLLAEAFEKGYSIEQVSLVSGHRDWKMLARYTQIKAKDLHRDIPRTIG